MAYGLSRQIDGDTWQVEAGSFDPDKAYVMVPLRALQRHNAESIGVIAQSLVPLARYAAALMVADYLSQSQFRKPQPSSAAEVIAFGPTLREFAGRGSKPIDEALRLVKQYEDYARHKLDTPAKRREIANNYKAIMAELVSRSPIGEACAQCGSTYNLTIDHIIPLIRGGTNDIRNLQILCRPCNSAKSDR